MLKFNKHHVFILYISLIFELFKILLSLNNSLNLKFYSILLYLIYRLII